MFLCLLDWRPGRASTASVIFFTPGAGVDFYIFPDQGILRIDLLDGREIRGVDRSGKSDPFAVFSLNGHKVFKSQTKKKTIAPEWNENFEVSVVCI